MLSKFFKLGLLSAILLATTFSFGQLPVPFKVRYQSYVKGDMTVIANNIVNRKDYGNNPNMPYMNATKTAKLNDEFEMFYIDVDKDTTTFSSSAATLYLENEDNKKIVYAGLYWSATYKYNSGFQKKENKFKAFDKNREEFDQIKLKLPGKSSYIDIKGEIIFDGLNKRGFDASAPYAVYADITNFVKDLELPTGEYIVANIKATQGQIEGGVSGGWTIFFVYEDGSEPGKFITSFDGFAGVTDRATDIAYTGFKTVPEGNVFAKFACAGLEGDNNLVGDQLQIKSQSSEAFTLLSSNLKSENNFFNSNIIVDDQFFNDRNPSSKNTLGYDTALITIANPENSVIQNNTDNVSLKLKTVGDRYFMFFNAFNVEIQEPVKQPDMIVENAIISSPMKISDPIVKPLIEQVKNETIIAALEEVPTEDKTKETVIEHINNEETVVTIIPNKPLINEEIVIANLENEIVTPLIEPVKNETIIAALEEVPTEDKTKETVIELINNEESVVTIIPSKPLINEEIVIANLENDIVAPQKKKIVINRSENLKDNNVVIVPKKEVVINHPKVKVEKDIPTQTTMIDPIMISEKLSNVAQNQYGNTQKIVAIPGPMVAIQNQQRGFYVIANVFAVHRNATRFVAKLRSMGIDANFFINPKNNYRYVFVSKNDTWSSALNTYYSNVNGKYHDKTWIMLVNTTPDQLVSNEQNIDYDKSFCSQQKIVATRNEEDLV